MTMEMPDHSGCNSHALYPIGVICDRSPIRRQELGQAVQKRFRRCGPMVLAQRAEG